MFSVIPPQPTDSRCNTHSRRGSLSCRVFGNLTSSHPSKPGSHLSLLVTHQWSPHIRTGCGFCLPILFATVRSFILHNPISDDVPTKHFISTKNDISDLPPDRTNIPISISTAEAGEPKSISQRRQRHRPGFRRGS